MGSKSRIAKRITAILSEHRKPHQHYVELFCGSCSTLSLMANPRTGFDISPSVVVLMQSLQNGWLPPDSLSETEYKRLKNEGQNLDPLYGFAAFGCSFAGKFFGSYARTKGRDIPNESARSLIKLRPYLAGAAIMLGDYKQARFPPGSLVYADPPYSGTEEYGDAPKFDTLEFWAHMRALVEKGHTVFVSEYAAPQDFVCVAEFLLPTTVAIAKSSIATEKLFVHKTFLLT